ncbi:MAG: hypothetical protein ACOCQ3_02465 [Natronomonas sp.]
MTGDTTLDRMRVILNRDGPINLAKRVLSFGYNQTIRPSLPQNGESIVDYNGVRVINDDGHWGDSLPLAGDIPLYEEPIIRSVQQYITEGSTVVVVGAGWGVVTTIVAGKIGNDGHCISYEGSEKMYNRASRTLELNNIGNNVALKHAIVVKNLGVWGDDGGADIIPTHELPKCNALILDCEGAEHSILPDLEQSPEVIIVEAHEGYDDIATELRNRGYKIVDKELYVPSEDTYVLTAIIE